jgi:hypothetical protein
MSYDYSISLEGIRNAERSFEQTASRIAAGGLPKSNESVPADSLFLSDYAAELIAIDQAKTALKTNLRVISLQQDLERKTLDLFA